MVISPKIFSKKKKKKNCFVFCNLKAAISTFLRYSRRPKHFWEENKYMKRETGCFIFNVLNILDYLFCE